jgi:hypothetical protein
MISQLQACSDSISSSQSDSSWMPFLQFVLSILIYATMHWIVHQNVALLHSWIHPFMNEMKRHFTISQDRRQSRSGGSYGMKDRRLVFIPNQTNVIQQNKVDISQSNDESHDSSIITSESTIIKRLDVPKKDPRFSWTLKRWKKVSDVKHEGNKSSRDHSGSSYYPLKCHQSRRIQQSRNTSNSHQYQRYPLITFRNRIENAFDRVALWYYVDRRLQKSR